MGLSPSGLEGWPREAPIVLPKEIQPFTIDRERNDNKDLSNRYETSLDEKYHYRTLGKKHSLSCATCS
jgi:hypothetical protein